MNKLWYFNWYTMWYGFFFFFLLTLIPGRMSQFVHIMNGWNYNCISIKKKKTHISKPLKTMGCGIPHSVVFHFAYIVDSNTSPAGLRELQFQT